MFIMINDVFNSSRALQSVLLDESCKVVSMEYPLASEVAKMVQDTRLWNELEAAHSPIKLVEDMAQEIEYERLLIGRCLPLWDELRLKIRNWCSNFCVTEGSVEKVVEQRFRMNYHPAWAAAFVLDPLYLIQDRNIYHHSKALLLNRRRMWIS